MRRNRAASVQQSVGFLISHFKQCIEAFNKRPPFQKYGQLEYHLSTIQRRRELGSVAAALADNVFLDNLHKTLKAWGIGIRGSRLLPLEQFKLALRAREPDIVRLDGFAIDDTKLDVNTISIQLWELIESLHIVENEAVLVPSTKALHHLLPDLVTPMDRRYTGEFFEWHDTEFQTRQRRLFEIAFADLITVARATNPSQYVSPGWHTSRTKVLDNAVVGFSLYLKNLATEALKDRA